MWLTNVCFQNKCPGSLNKLAALSFKISLVPVILDLVRFFSSLYQRQKKTCGCPIVVNFFVVEWHDCCVKRDERFGSKNIMSYFAARFEWVQKSRHTVFPKSYLQFSWCWHCYGLQSVFPLCTIFKKNWRSIADRYQISRHILLQKKKQQIVSETLRKKRLLQALHRFQKNIYTTIT